jgi:hypothetical protein
MAGTTALLNFILDSERWVLKTKESAKKISSAVVLGLDLNLQLFLPIKGNSMRKVVTILRQLFRIVSGNPVGVLG